MDFKLKIQMLLFFGSLLSALNGVTMAASGVADVYAIRAGRIVTVSSGVIENGIIIIRDGIIEKVGDNIEIPVEAELIEADSLTVYPGLIDACVSLALKKKPVKKPPDSSSDSDGETSPPESIALLQPEWMASDWLDPKDAKIKSYREIGVTTALTALDDGIFIGQSCLINLAGDAPEEMIIKSPVALHIGFARQRGDYPSTLMGVMAFQRQTFLDVNHHRLLWERYARQKRGWRRPLANKSLDALFPALDRRMPVIMLADRENEIKRALALAEEFRLNTILAGATEGWRVAELLKSQQVPVLLSLNFPKPDQVTGYPFKLKIEGPKTEPASAAKKPASAEATSDKKSEPEKDDAEMSEIYANAARLSQAGIKFAFCSKGLKKPEDFIKNAAKAVKHGLAEDTALRALTLNAAQIFGVSNQIGSIEDGKIANLLLTTGNIFEDKAAIHLVFVDGKKFEVKKDPSKKADNNSGAAPANVSGAWSVTVESPQGAVAATLTLHQSGSEITGEFSSEVGASPIYNSRLSGNELEFSVKLIIAGSPLEITFYGTVTGNSMEGAIDLGEMGSAGFTAIKPEYQRL